MNKTDKFRSDMVTENIELKKELKLVSEQLQAVNNGCVELKARWGELKNILRHEVTETDCIHCKNVLKDMQELEKGGADGVQVRQVTKTNAGSNPAPSIESGGETKEEPTTHPREKAFSKEPKPVSAKEEIR